MDIWVRKDIQDSWIFQDGERFRWWVDLHFLADENGEIHMSLSDLARRWKTNKTSVHRFVARLSTETISGTKVKRSAERITIYRIDSYEDGRNAKWNESGTQSGTPQERSPVPPAPPLTPKESIIVSNNNARTREGSQPWDEDREKAYKEQFRAEGRLMASAKKVQCDAIGISNYLERFMAHCQSVDYGHTSIGHFGAHFNKFVEAEKSRPLVRQEGQSTLDWNTQIAKDLGLID